MGYQDRDYFRDGQHPYLELIRSTRVCWGIVIVYTLGYLAVMMTSGYPLREALALDPAAIVQDWQWYRLLTATLVVDNPWHLIFALVLIWLMGHELEQLYGAREFLLYFVLCTLLGGLAQTLIYRFNVPVAGLPVQVGAAPAALAVTLFGVLQAPYRPVAYLFLPMPLWVFGLLVGLFEGGYFLKGVALPARIMMHAGPLVFTALYFQLNWRLVGKWSVRAPRRATTRRQLASVLSAMPETPAQREEAGPVLKLHRPVDEQLEAKMDAILEKVTKSGMDSLTPEEKKILQRASEALRQKRH